MWEKWIVNGREAEARISNIEGMPAVGRTIDSAYIQEMLCHFRGAVHEGCEMVDQDLFDFIHCWLRCFCDELQIAQGLCTLSGRSDFVREGLLASVADKAVCRGTEMYFGPFIVECRIAVCTFGQHQPCADLV